MIPRPDLLVYTMTPHLLRHYLLCVCLISFAYLSENSKCWSLCPKNIKISPLVLRDK